jgi:hypothetical protein
MRSFRSTLKGSITSIPLGLFIDHCTCPTSWSGCRVYEVVTVAGLGLRVAGFGCRQVIDNLVGET